MSVTFNDTSSTSLQGLVQHLKFLTGQDALSIYDATRLLNFALDDYSYLALTSDGRWKFDDTTHTNASGNPTYPIATATLEAGATSIPLETNFLSINEVAILGDNGRYHVLRPVDERDDKYNALDTVYNAQGEPMYYDYDAHALFPYPCSNTSRTMRIKYSRATPYFSVTDTTAEVGIPRIHHEYLVLHAAYKLAMRTNDKNATSIRNELNQYEKKIVEWYSKRDEDTPRRLKPNMPTPFTGSSRRGGRINNNISGLR